MKKRIRLISVLALLGCAFAISSQNAAEATEARRIENLRAFAKVYGYIRWFHPSDEAASLDWNRFAVHGAGRAKAARDDRELKSILEELFLPIAPTSQILLGNEAPKDLGRFFPKDRTGLLPVAWQHRGVGFGQMGAYISARTNRETVLRTAVSFGTVTQSVSAASYLGKEFKLSGRARVDGDGGGRGFLWLRVDKADRKMGFFYNMADRPIVSIDWKPYEFTGRVDPDAAFIVFGGMLQGGGRFWLDDVRLEIKDETGKWQAAPIANPGFEAGADGAAPPGWGVGGQGYGGKTSASHPVEGGKCLLLESAITVVKERLFEAVPEPGEILTKPLTKNLACRFPAVLLSDGRGTLGNDDQKTAAALVESLTSIDVAGLTADDENVRLAAAVIAWNVFQHFYPYFDVVKADWDAALTAVLTGALRDKNQNEFLDTLSRLVARLEDGHGNVYLMKGIRQAMLPVALEWIEGRVVVTATADPALFRPGDVLRTLGGKPASEILGRNMALSSGSLQWIRRRALLRMVIGPAQGKVAVSLDRAGTAVDVEAAYSQTQPVVESKRPAIDSLAEGVFYVDLDRATWEQIEPRINDLAAAKGVVFDLRGYPRDNHLILCHLLRGPDNSDAWMWIPRIIYPDRDKIAGWDKSGWKLAQREPKIKGKVAFLTDARAISYAESFLSFVEHYKLGEIVGGSTAGANGNVNPFELPGGYRVTWTGMRVVKHDGSQHHLVGIQPTVPLERTIRGVREGRDELLDKALDLVR